MFETAASRKLAGRRYNWCPGCGELWLAGWMAAADVDRCPSCGRGVLPYIGRSPYDVGHASADDGPKRARRRRESNADGLTLPRRFTA
jgi:hypothetical protein